MVKLIVAIDLMGNIGKNNNLLFHIKEDMKFFKQQTMNNICVMGYNTWLSLNEKELPNRKNIVMTNERIEGVETSNHLFKVIDKYEKDDRDIYIIGGAYVYNEALKLHLVDEILITIVSTIVTDADTQIDLSLMDKFKKKEKINDFINEDGILTTIWKWSK